MIGKNFREATKDTMGTRSAGGMRRDTNKWEPSDNYDNFRQLFSTLKNMETASRTRNALGERMFETTWTTRDTLFKVRRLNGRRMDNGWGNGRDTRAGKLAVYCAKS